MSKSIASLIRIARQGIPFAGASARIGETHRETHRAKKALPMRLPIPTTLRNPQKQRNLERQKKCTQPRASTSVSPPCAKNLHI